MEALSKNWKNRPTEDSEARVVISGAGPVGLRAAVEAALMGMRVHVIEKRDVFSRVNILMLWQGTADDLVAYGAKVFYPKFTNRHMGTRGVCCSACVSLFAASRSSTLPTIIGPHTSLPATSATTTTQAPPLSISARVRSN